MSVYTQIANLPIVFQVGSGKINQVDAILSNKNFSFNNIILLSGGSFSFDVSKELDINGLQEHEIVHDNSLDEVHRLSDRVYRDRFDLIVAVGGGKVLDVAKRISQIQRINHISIPTIISNDGLISPISVLKNNKGITESMPGNMPTGVIIDLDIIKEAPSIYLQAAAGDILSNISATYDWHYAASTNHERVNDVGYQLSLMAAHSLVNFKNTNLDSKYFLKMVIQGQVNSGIAMALSGSSRPCSGSEHLISHALDFLGYSESTLHGYQVGVFSLFCLYLQNKINRVHLDYAKSIGLNLNVKKTYSISDKEWIEVFRVSRSMRPGRVTILEKYSDSKLLNKQKKFNDELNNNQSMVLS